jgi:F-type H+-transporting ATPase subunit a
VIGYLRSFIPAGVTGGMKGFIFVLEALSNFMRIISLSVRLFANVLAGHLIILFMAGALSVILGIAALTWITLPLGIALFAFEVGLVAALQAFIFATLTAIYIGGAAQSH